MLDFFVSKLSLSTKCVWIARTLLGWCRGLANTEVWGGNDNLYVCVYI